MPSGIYKHKPLSEIIKGKMSERKKGKNNPAYGKHYYHSKKIKKKISKEMKGENHWNWKGGISKNSSKKWREKNRDYVNYLNLRRVALKKKAKGSHTFKEWEILKKQYGFICPCCKKQEPKIKLTEDHIIPLSKGGSDNIENIQPLCRNCNSKKNIKVIRYDK